MGWEARGSHSYYYRKERDGSSVRSVYVGRGEMAQLTAALLAMQREDRRIKNQKLQQEQASLKALDLDLDVMLWAVNTMMDAALIVAGFHQHKRQWRKRRT
jgi:hypothetical protein